MSELFTPYKIGPIELRNRTVRSAAFEAMCPGQRPSKELFDYHTAVARGGIGMTTVAYAAVCRSGLSFENQLWMREEIVPELKALTDAIHAEGAKASIQLGHCGNMSHRTICGCIPYGASRGFNLYSPTIVQKMNLKQINEVAEAYGRAVELAIKAGFDAIEVHAGHGYLISQFLSPCDDFIFNKGDDPDSQHGHHRQQHHRREYPCAVQLCHHTFTEIAQTTLCT